MGEWAEFFLNSPSSFFFARIFFGQEVVFPLPLSPLKCAQKWKWGVTFWNGVHILRGFFFRPSGEPGCVLARFPAVLWVGRRRRRRKRWGEETQLSPNFLPHFRTGGVGAPPPPSAQKMIRSGADDAFFWKVPLLSWKSISI